MRCPEAALLQWWQSVHALDSDVILAACAATIGHPGDQILVATQNVGHLARYCDARLWTTIA
ncbi:MAG: hypothetical protein WB773_02945 [Isosphaeraceae bacterium]